MKLLLQLKTSMIVEIKLIFWVCMYVMFVFFFPYTNKVNFMLCTGFEGN